MVNLAHERVEPAMLRADEAWHAQRGKWASGQSGPLETLAHDSRHSCDRVADDRRDAMALEDTPRAAAHIELAVTGHPTQQHHRATRAAHGRRMVGEHHQGPNLARGVDKRFGDCRRACMEMDDPRSRTREHPTERTRRVLIRRAVRVSEGGGRGACEAKDRDAGMRVSRLYLTRRSNSALDSLGTQRGNKAFDINLGSTDSVRKVRKRDVQNIRAASGPRTLGSVREWRRLCSHFNTLAFSTTLQALFVAAP